VRRSHVQKVLSICALAFAVWSVACYFRPCFEAQARLDLGSEVRRMYLEILSDSFHGCVDPFPIETKAEKVLFEIVSKDKQDRSTAYRKQRRLLSGFRVSYSGREGTSCLLSFRSPDARLSIQVVNAIGVSYARSKQEQLSKRNVGPGTIQFSPATVTVRKWPYFSTCLFLSAICGLGSLIARELELRSTGLLSRDSVQRAT
jgi:hypothetical protein